MRNCQSNGFSFRGCLCALRLPGHGHLNRFLGCTFQKKDTKCIKMNRVSYHIGYTALAVVGYGIRCGTYITRTHTIRRIG